MENKETIKEIYKIRNDFMLIGLTGRTGSGCTTVANILKKEKFEDLTLKTPKKRDFQNIEERKYRAIYKFMKNNWSKFQIIEVSAVILSFVFKKDKKQLKSFIKNLKGSKGEKIKIKDEDKLCEQIDNNFNSFFEKAKEIERLDLSDKNNYFKFIGYYLDDLVKCKNEIKDIFKNYTCIISRSSKISNDNSENIDLYTYFMQTIGNNIRRTGNPYKFNNEVLTLYTIAEEIDKLIKIINENAKEENKDEMFRNVRICIDAFRNPLEVIYFREKYRAFQLIAINAEENDRKKRISYLNMEQINNIDKIEYPKSNSTELIFYHQNIAKCLEISDIYLYNPNVNGEYYDLSAQIIKYISLMLHPGLVTPTNIERCMQVAYNVRYNSGCLSRQVGAVVTDNNYSIKSVGWNDVPKGHVPCNLRDISEYCLDKDNGEYSKYELYNNKFKEALNKVNKKIKNLKNIEFDTLFQFCFKDVYNAIEGKKNQVHTRALHAEENAFLQISKFGGIGINGGYLFTTASPCELCAKKACQLGIKKVFYIDPYPGISRDHIFNFGKVDNPEMILFKGAIGNAYLSLYAPKLPVKDELELKTGINIEKIVTGDKERDFRKIEYKEYSATLKIDKNGDYLYTVERNIVNKIDLTKKIEHKFSWDGTYAKLIPNNNDNFSVLNDKYRGSIVDYEVVPNEPLEKDQNFKYKIKFLLTDRNGSAEQKLSCYIKHKTELLIMCIESSKELKNIKLYIYADKEKTIEYKILDVLSKCEEKSNDSEIKFNFNETKKLDNSNYIYKIEIKNPIMFYSYSIEWDR